MGKYRIEKFSIGYFLVNAFAGLMFYFYYSKIKVRGKENIPRGKPIIFTPNHQNALMDALALVYSYPKQLIFLTRSDIFKRPILKKILIYLRMLPVYRIRDGYAALAGNKEIFDKTIDVLRSNTPLVILPEGNHIGLRKIRQLKKGLARIAFQTEDASDFTLGIEIVPVGLHYSKYEKSGGELLIQYGEPIKVSEFVDGYKENQPKAINELMAEVKEQIGNLIINIQDEEYYDMIDILRKSFSWSLLKKRKGEGLSWRRFRAEMDLVALMKEIIPKNEKTGKLKELNNVCIQYNKLVKSMGFSLRCVEEDPYPTWKLILQSITFVVFSPLFLVGAINNIIPFVIGRIVNRKIKDVQFRSSIKLGISALSFPIFYIIQTILFHQLVPVAGFYTWIYMLSLPLVGIFAMHYRWKWRRFMSRLNFRLLPWFNREKYNKIKKQRQVIESTMNQLVND